MTTFIENDFTTNNYITISKKIINIPFFSSYYFPIINSKNLDETYNHDIDQREIQYKLIYFITNDYLEFDFNNNFNKSLYHTFVATSILHQHNISYTLNCDSFVTHNESLPLLCNFSNSFYFPNIYYNDLQEYFSLSLLDNPYIPIDIFIITYIVHNNITTLSDNDIQNISELYSEGREKINKNTIFINLSYFLNYSTNQIIKYLFQFKYTWTYHSLAYYFIIHYPILLSSQSLYELFNKYINSTFKERNVTLIDDIHNKLFVC
tara:strand:+ start:317 stop:1108 length:792 start_codon:yes stop_codon:yes gene_type:complete